MMHQARKTPVFVLNTIMSQYSQYVLLGPTQMSSYLSTSDCLALGEGSIFEELENTYLTQAGIKQSFAYLEASKKLVELGNFGCD